MIHERPSWCCRPVQIKNLMDIVPQLRTLLYKIKPDFGNLKNGQIMYIPVERKLIDHDCPLYSKYIESLNLLDRWEFSLISVIGPRDTDLDMDKLFNKIHVDTTNWNYRCYGLNIPIINCENTYTVWYEGTIDETEIKTDKNRLRSAKNLVPGSRYVEIHRHESSVPAWINVSIPHMPLNYHNKPRAVISARFTPEIHEYF